MSQKATIHRVRIELSDTDRQVYEDLQLSIARAESETAHRLVARLLAYCLCYEPDIAFTGGVGAGDEPDVWVREPGGRVKVWIEVGLPDPRRLAKAARHCERVVLLAYGRRLPDWDAEHGALLGAAGNITVTAVELPFLDQLVALLDRVITWSLTVSGGTLYLTSGDRQLETTLRHMSGPSLS
ncbi:MAG: YaeQ family protein [Armatimonadota bacterium]